MSVSHLLAGLVLLIQYVLNLKPTGRSYPFSVIIVLNKVIAITLKSNIGS